MFFQTSELNWEFKVQEFEEPSWNQTIDNKFCQFLIFFKKVEPSIFPCIQLGSLEFPTSNHAPFFRAFLCRSGPSSSSWTSYVLQIWHYMMDGPIANNQLSFYQLQLKQAEKKREITIPPQLSSCSTFLNTSSCQRKHDAYSTTILDPCESHMAN